MEILEWFQLLNDLVINQTELSLRINNVLFVLYVLLAIATKRVAPLAAFFMSVLLVDNVVLSRISEPAMYMIVFAIYTYVFHTCTTLISRFCCVIMMLTSFVFAVDAKYYGVGGLYGESETFIYSNIEHIALFVNILFICSFISYKRIRDCLQRLFDSVVSFSRNSACFFIC